MTVRVMTVVGARPQFIKAAVVSHEFARHRNYVEEIIHTGQHFDYNMSQAFFEDLGIPEPSVNLGVSGGSHAEMTGQMLILLEQELQKRNPDILLLYGDTNSTLAGALAAAKLHIPIVHVEAGARTGSMTNPEEINRICVDHVAGCLMACTKRSIENLRLEGLDANAIFVGDPMYDAFLQYTKLAQRPQLVSILDGELVEVPDDFYYATCHREENTSEDYILESLIGTLNMLDKPVVYPVHPRNRSRISMLAKQFGTNNLLLCQPVGYLESVWLVNHASQIITDSGGLQREAFFAGVKCTTLLPFEVWPETMVGNRNLLASPTFDSISQAMEAAQEIDEQYIPFGDGHAARHIVNGIDEFMGRI